MDMVNAMDDQVFNPARQHIKETNEHRLKIMGADTSIADTPNPWQSTSNNSPLTPEEAAELKALREKHKK
jgi:hypothetical protein